MTSTTTTETLTKPRPSVMWWIGGACLYPVGLLIVGYRAGIFTGRQCVIFVPLSIATAAGFVGCMSVADRMLPDASVASFAVRAACLALYTFWAWFVYACGLKARYWSRIGNAVWLTIVFAFLCFIAWAVFIMVRFSQIQ